MQTVAGGEPCFLQSVRVAGHIKGELVSPHNVIGEQVTACMYLVSY